MGIPTREQMREWPRGLLVSGLAGLCVAAVAYLCAYYEMRNYYGYREGQVEAMNSLRAMYDALEDYRKTNGAYPPRLADLKGVKPDLAPGYVDVDENGELIDPWRNPYQYRVQGQGYSLFSFGEDGKPGGVGLHEDVDVEDRTPSGTGFVMPDVGLPTLEQFTYERATEGVRLACGLAGLAAFLGYFIMGVGRPASRFAILKLAGTALACIAVAVLMSLVHLPSHH